MQYSLLANARFALELTLSALLFVAYLWQQPYIPELSWMLPAKLVSLVVAMPLAGLQLVVSITDKLQEQPSTNGFLSPENAAAVLGVSISKLNAAATALEVLMLIGSAVLFIIIIYGLGISFMLGVQLKDVDASMTSRDANSDRVTPLARSSELETARLPEPASGLATVLHGSRAQALPLVRERNELDMAIGTRRSWVPRWARRQRRLTHNDAL